MSKTCHFWAGTIYGCAAVRKELLAGIGDGSSPAGTWFLDLSGVERVDAAAMQLLIALRKEIEARGGRLRLSGECTPLSECLATFELDAGFEE